MSEIERWTLNRCAGCGRVSMGRSPTEHCPDTERMETQESIEVVPARATPAPRDPTKPEWSPRRKWWRSTRTENS